MGGVGGGHTSEQLVCGKHASQKFLCLFGRGGVVGTTTHIRSVGAGGGISVRHAHSIFILL